MTHTITLSQSRLFQPFEVGPKIRLLRGLSMSKLDGSNSATVCPRVKRAHHLRLFGSHLRLAWTRFFHQKRSGDAF